MNCDRCKEQGVQRDATNLLPYASRYLTKHGINGVYLCDDCLRAVDAGPGRLRDCRALAAYWPASGLGPIRLPEAR